MAGLLTDAKARKITPSDKTMTVGGAKGLYLKPSAAKGSGKFVLRYVSPTTGKRRDMGLGKYPEISIGDARRMAFEVHQQIADGVDPIDHRNTEKSEAAQRLKMLSFEEAAELVYEDISPSFRNAKHSAQWINTLRTYVYPYLGKKPVDQLTTDDFARALRPIWLSKAETASRVSQRCQRVMTWCVAQRLVAYNPVLSVNALLPKQPKTRDRVVHHPAAPWRDMPDIMQRLASEQTRSVGREALVFLILTAARSGEVRGAIWDEIDFENKVWTIPGTRMKAGRQHRVPLSSQAIDILERRADVRDSALVFSTRIDKPLSDMTLTKQLRRYRFPSDTPDAIVTAHGFRSTFRDWASENGYPRDLAERALAHTIANATEAAYHRTDQLEQRRDMMEEWSEYVCFAACN